MFWENSTFSELGQEKSQSRTIKVCRSQTFYLITLWQLSYGPVIQVRPIIHEESLALQWCSSMERYRLQSPGRLVVPVTWSPLIQIHFPSSILRASWYFQNYPRRFLPLNSSPAHVNYLRWQPRAPPGTSRNTHPLQLLQALLPLPAASC